MYRYPKQILIIEQRMQSYVDVEKALKTIGFYRLRGYLFHLYDNIDKKYSGVRVYYE